MENSDMEDFERLLIARQKYHHTFVLIIWILMLIIDIMSFFYKWAGIINPLWPFSERDSNWPRRVIEEIFQETGIEDMVQQLEKNFTTLYTNLRSQLEEMRNLAAIIQEGKVDLCQRLVQLREDVAAKNTQLANLRTKLQQAANHAAKVPADKEILIQEYQKVAEEVEKIKTEQRTATERLDDQCSLLVNEISTINNEIRRYRRTLKDSQDLIAALQEEMKWIFFYFVPYHSSISCDYISPDSTQRARKSNVEIITQIKEMCPLNNPPVSTYEFYMEQKENSYPVNNVFRGRALLVTMTVDRPGWEADLTSLIQLFKTVKYPFEVLLDPTRQCLADCLQKFANHPFNRFVDSAFVFIMGHGGTDEKGREFIQTSDQQHFTVRETLEAFFSDSKCKALSGKPKIFALQKCRGRPVCDSSNPSTSDCIEHDVRVISQPGDPDIRDYVLAYSCQPGKPSLRNTTTGSWFIQEFVKVMLEKAPDTHFVDMLVEVNRRVRNIKGGNMETAFPATEIGLTLPFYLFPGIYMVANSEASLIHEMEE